MGIQLIYMVHITLLQLWFLQMNIPGLETFDSKFEQLERAVALRHALFTQCLLPVSLARLGRGRSAHGWLMGVQARAK